MARFKRMQGYNVLHPMGWDSFGEPAEQFAIKHGVHPRVTTDRNTARFKQQMHLMGKGIDWDREIDSSRPEFYRWTQWFFLLLYRRGLAYRDLNWQWWCPTCRTTLSSHEVTDGVCWRGHSGVTRREIPAWYFRITAYADRLLSGLETLDWPESIKALQRNWIGRSEGAEVMFRTQSGETIPVFTTRPETIYGVTFLALAPEHPLIARITTDAQRAEVEAYMTQAARRSEIERMTEDREKTGVFTGCYATNPLNGEAVPVWVADYVLPAYGTGAIMGVPAHDERDQAFVRRYPQIPERRVIDEQHGRLVQCGPLSGLSCAEGARRIIEHLEAEGMGKRAIRYRMRDWLISRQRYWGTPIPVVHCAACGVVPLPEEQLPLLLPEMSSFEPDGTGSAPLARVPEFVQTACPRCGGAARRETDTLGGFACSSWYYLRFASPKYTEGPFEPAAMRYWLPVDLYVGGSEHATLHLLYARFWTKVLYDAGLVPFQEPFPRLRNQGQLLAPDGQRMAKSRGNVITPEHIAATYGVDTLRVYELFIAPFEQTVNWSEQGISGVRRFLNRVWELYAGTYAASSSATAHDAELDRLTQKLIRRVIGLLEEMKYNSMIAACMEYMNVLRERWQAGRWQTATFHQALDTFLLLLAPIAPHITEELWRLTGHQESIHRQAWPIWDEQRAADETQRLAIQVNGRVRCVMVVPAGLPEEQARSMALEQPEVRRHLREQPVSRVYYVPGRIINIVTGN